MALNYPNNRSSDNAVGLSSRQPYATNDIATMVRTQPCRGDIHQPRVEQPLRSPGLNDNRKKVCHRKDHFVLRPLWQTDARHARECLAHYEIVYAEEYLWHQRFVIDRNLNQIHMSPLQG